MNLVKLQDIKLIHKKFLNSYILTIKDQREIKEIIPFNIATKRIKYLGITYLRTQNIHMQKTIRY